MSDAIDPGDLVVCVNVASNHGTGRPAPLRHRRLDLDGARSWIILSEWNEFVWPSPDLRRRPGSDDSSIVYGVLPPGLFAAVRDRFVYLPEKRSAHPVRRT